MTVAIIRSVVFFLPWLILISLNIVAADLTDQNESCSYWASLGECDKNAGTMKEETVAYGSKCSFAH
jgi:hypothetical protein